MTFDKFLLSFSSKPPLPKIDVKFKVVSWFVLMHSVTFSSLYLLLCLCFWKNVINELLYAYSFVLPLCCLYFFYFSMFVLKNAVIREYNVKIIAPSDFKHQMEDDVYKIVDTLRVRAGLANSIDVGFYESPDINAMAVGKSANSALIVFSWGLLRSMSGFEIAAVAAHEIAHVASGDMVTTSLLLSATKTFVSVVLLPFFVARFVLVFVISLVSRGNAECVNFVDDVFRVLVYSPVEKVVFFATNVVESWFSRSREYKADALAAVLADGEYMVSALNKLAATSPKSSAFSTYQIAAPTAKFALFADLLRTHPAVEKRVAALQNR